MLILILVHLIVFSSIKAQQCGRTTENLSGKIVGGYDVGYYKYPYFASLVLDGTPWCGSTLIGNNVVVTAAHCFKEQLMEGNTQLEKVYKVLLGVYKSCKNESTQRLYKVKKVIVHELYQKNQPYYDIALMVLDGDATSFEPACLPPKALNDKEKGHEGLIVGLGTIKYGASKYPCNVREGRILLYSDKICKAMIKGATDDPKDYPMTSAFCAGYKEGGVDACQGDSGGPLFIMGPNNRYIVIGITSFGYDCAKKDLMGIYTDVSQYLDWIEKKGGVKQEGLTTPSETPVAPPATPISPPSDTTHSPITNQDNQSVPFFWWPPKRIIIEYKHKQKAINHKKKPQKHKKKHHLN